MQVSIRLSAALAQITGCTARAGHGGRTGNRGRCNPVLLEQYPALAPRLKYAVPIVGGNHASPHDPLVAGQEVAFLMPVAGGALR